MASHPRRAEAHPTPSFTWGNLVNLAAIPLVTGAIMLIGWYFLSSDTLKRHDVAIDQIRADAKADREAFRSEAKADRELFQASLKTDRETVAAKVEEEKRARVAVRDEFLTSQRTLTDVLGKLDTRLSVGEKQQDTMSRQIEKISDLLQRVPVAPAKTR